MAKKRKKGRERKRKGEEKTGGEATASKRSLAKRILLPPQGIITPQLSILQPESPHERRMRQLAESQPLPSTHPLAETVNARIQRRAAMALWIQSETKAAWQRFPHFVNARMRGGSGLLMSVTLRDYFHEFNWRLSRHGIYSLPTSFNVGEAFFLYNRRYFLFDIRQEKEHLLTADDYFEWYDVSDMPKEPSVLMDVMEDGVIYSYNMTGDPEGYQIQLDGSTCVIAGVSLVRHKHELSCVLVAGEAPPHLSDSEVVEHLDSMQLAKGKEGLKPDPKFSVKDRYLPTHPDFARVIVLSRFDLRASKYDVRYVLADRGAGFDILTDDSDIWRDDCPSDEIENMVKDNLQRMGRYNDLFSVLAAMIYLPIAFVDQAEHVHDITFATDLLANKADKSVQDILREIGESECTFECTIRCMATSGEQKTGSEKSLSPPELEFKSESHWKTLPAGQVGEDQDGNQIVGKTWVTRTDTWSTRSPRSFLLQRPKKTVEGDDPGIIYIMRSGAHHIDVFKIGLTRRTAEARAKELSSTGVPLPFDILVKWEVGDCAAIKAEVHDRLKPHRVNPRREFFRTNLADIVKVVQEVIGELEDGSQEVTALLDKPAVAPS